MRESKYFYFCSIISNLLVDHQVAVVDVDEVVLEGTDMSGTSLNGFLVKN